jgi:predicted transcriptional regulator
MKIAQQAIMDIKHKVEAAGFKMSDLSRVAEINQAQISRWQNGITEPLYSTVVRLDEAANALVSARMTMLNKAMDEAVK